MSGARPRDTSLLAECSCGRSNRRRARQVLVFETMDAHLAALAIEHGAELCSADADFSRFPGLRSVNPLA